MDLLYGFIFSFKILYTTKVSFLLAQQFDFLFPGLILTLRYANVC